jgi:hypothetical protein
MDGGDSEAMRVRARQLRDQAVDLRALADQLITRADGVSWSGPAAETLQGRVRERAVLLRDAADGHEVAAASLERHLREVERVRACR